MFYDLIHIYCLTSSKEASLKAVKLSQSKMRYPNLWGLPVVLESMQEARLRVTQKTHWIYQNLMLMSWLETTERTNVLLMTQGFRNDLSYLSRPQNYFLPLWSSWYSLQMTISLKWKKILGSGQKRKVISESLGHKENVGVLRCFRSWHWH